MNDAKQTPETVHGPVAGHEEFGSLDDLCLSHVPGAHREVTGEASGIYPDPEAPKPEPADAMDMLSLCRPR
jgi:hypothetical protein